MQAFVHFAVGLAGGLIVVLVLDRPARQEFAIVLSSGVWALVPDFWWAFHEFGYASIALVGRRIHGSPLMNVFWFHRILDRLETGSENLEAGLAIVLLVGAGMAYYVFNDWESA